MTTLNLHLVSDSTGETVGTVAHACMVQFPDVDAEEFIWPMVRTKGHVAEVIAEVRKNPGFVLYTLVNPEISRILEDSCRELQIPCMGLLDPIVAAIGGYIGAKARARPGLQHVLDAQYFGRIDAIQFALVHDDGQSLKDVGGADVLILGVSRTSKTPTCMYLAYRGIKAANVPVVSGIAVPREIFEVEMPLIVALTESPRRLVEIRRNRVRLLNRKGEDDYTDVESVSREVNEALRFYTEHGWPIIDVTRRSVEETAATIVQMLKRRRDAAD